MESPIDVEEVELQFSPSRWSRRMSATEVIKEHFRIATEVSADVKNRIPNSLDMPYGDSEGQKLDLFGLDALPSDVPIFVYIHGGCWQELGRPTSSYCVEPLYKESFGVIIIGYDLAPAVSLEEIIKQVERAAAHILEMAQERKSKGVFFCGHSAGAHLMATLANSEVLNKHPNAQLVKGFIYIGGIFDLRNIVHTYVNDALNLTLEDAARYSPLLHVNLTINSAVANAQHLVVAGEFESPEYQRQSCRYAEILKEKGLPVLHATIPFVDHFNLVENLRDENYVLTKMIVQLIKQKTTAPKPESIQSMRKKTTADKRSSAVEEMESLDAVSDI